MNNSTTGVGITDELSLRVSVGSLVSVLFDNPKDGRSMIALERIATLKTIDEHATIEVKAKPFGGGDQITDPQALKALIGNFHYDSERSLSEQDFRILIRPASWDLVKKICRDHWTGTGNKLLETGPERELTEEFGDSLHIRITPDMYSLKPRWMIIEDLPGKTDNVNAQGLPTVRVYYVYEASINDPRIINMMLDNSARFSNKDLHKIALEDARQGGKGRANALLVTGLHELTEIYSSISINRHSGPVHFGEHLLDGNVPAVLEEIRHPKYHKFI